MGEIVAVLVVSADGDPGGLLAEGPCYAWPPRVGSSEPHDYGGSWQVRATEWTPMGWDEQGAYDMEALPLWWDGELVPEGWDRARRVYAAACLAIGHLETAAGAMAAVDPRDAEGAERMGHSLVGLGVAYPAHRTVTRVVRLARVDGRLVEVSDG